MVLYECLRLFAILPLVGELVAEYVIIFVFANVTMIELCASNSNDWVCINLCLAVNFYCVWKSMKHVILNYLIYLFALNYND